MTSNVTVIHDTAARVDTRAAELVALAEKDRRRRIHGHILDNHLHRLASIGPDFSLGQARYAFHQLVDAVKHRDAVGAGHSDVIDETHPHDFPAVRRHEQAMEAALQNVDAALWPLIHGSTRRCRRCLGHGPAAVRPAVNGTGLCETHGGAA